MTYTREPMRTVKARLGKFQDEVLCDCLLCLAAKVEEPPVCVPDGRGPNDFGEEVDMGRWLHGQELAQFLAARRRFKAKFEAVMQAIAEPSSEEPVSHGK